MALDLTLRCLFVLYYMPNPLLQTLVTTAGLVFDVHIAASRNQVLWQAMVFVSFFRGKIFREMSCCEFLILVVFLNPR
jgi:hypothetical protein